MANPDECQSKRDFAMTPEPAGLDAGSDDRWFVIQRHDTYEGHVWFWLEVRAQGRIRQTRPKSSKRSPKLSRGRKLPPDQAVYQPRPS